MSFILEYTWHNYEDIAIQLYEKFGDDYTEAKIYRTRFTDLRDYVMSLKGFIGKLEACNESHLEMIQSSWVYEWRDNQK
jgi:FeS assembly protein IscX